MLSATDIAATIVTRSHAGNIDLVVVAGDVLKENRVPKGEDAVVVEAAASRDWLFHAASLPLPV
ncbi:hypothetical protein [Streptomyces rochei]|uniref:hypothetical protein n=1 Tax=Streptomyces rochei TaxID=1928 RepID=UPI0022E9F4C7|nr:hypothetical protein [Streptomyces rochei]MCC8450354.1 hypothetical protein [Streptomyces rochei]